MEAKKFELNAMDEWITKEMIPGVASVEKAIGMASDVMGVPDGLSAEEFVLFAEGAISGVTLVSRMFDGDEAWDAEEVALKIFRSFVGTRGLGDEH